MQSVSASLPDIEVLPTGQLLQDTVPDKSVYFPSSHFSQVAEPSAEENVPGAHFEQTEAPVLLNCPALQSAHVLEELAPVAVEDFPLTQAVHVLTPIPVEYLPATQAMHALKELAPVTVEDFPLTQEVQVLVPVNREYVPLTQACLSFEPPTQK